VDRREMKGTLARALRFMGARTAPVEAVAAMSTAATEPVA